MGAKLLILQLRGYQVMNYFLVITIRKHCPGFEIYCLCSWIWLWRWSSVADTKLDVCIK